MSNKKARVQSLEAKISNKDHWVILPHFDNVDGVKQVRNSATGKTLPMPEFEKLGISPDLVMEVEVVFV